MVVVCHDGSVVVVHHGRSIAMVPRWCRGGIASWYHLRAKDIFIVVVEERKLPKRREVLFKYPALMASTP